ncbi:hypothetical protein SS50377_24606 [Spironucleus salmonicida]|uniref:Uncharacterized protein n=1 Tax=Spironucleus salmonicida TaxID=348837 RepID=V6LLC7_9EUKA|nr:hypothetical protein SS50377_24606 [Spironucleus salmonicida]|eukprot:EST44541.1 Hypothetical protein SS50377_15541 [Spironucleus salmonicida]
MQDVAFLKDMVQAAGESNKKLEKENEVLKFQVEKLQIMLEREQIQRKAIQKSHEELWSRHEREMQCYAETVEHLVSHSNAPINSSVQRPEVQKSQNNYKTSRDSIMQANTLRLLTLQ